MNNSISKMTTAIQSLAPKSGDFIDVYVGKWLVGLVTAVDPQTGFIDFTSVGWGSEYSYRNVNPRSDKIKEFRS